MTASDTSLREKALRATLRAELRKWPDNADISIDGLYVITAGELAGILDASEAKDRRIEALEALEAENERMRGWKELHDAAQRTIADRNSALNYVSNRMNEFREALEDVRKEFRTEYEGGKLGGISHDMDALPRVIDILDRALSGKEGQS